MEKRENGPENSQQEPAAQADASADRKPWEAPKLAFVEPKLTKHGNLEKITGMPNSFFGGFSP